MEHAAAMTIGDLTNNLEVCSMVCLSALKSFFALFFFFIKFFKTHFHNVLHHKQQRSIITVVIDQSQFLFVFRLYDQLCLDNIIDLFLAFRVVT